MKKRNTIQKKLVLESVKSFHGHPTAQEIYEDIISYYPGISKATVYRNLNTLSDDGFIDKISFPGSPERYDIVTDGHFHGVCRKCGKLIDIGTDLRVDVDMNSDIIKRKNIDSYIVYFSGLCTDCM